MTWALNMIRRRLKKLITWIWIFWIIWTLWISNLVFTFSVYKCKIPLGRNSSRVLIVADPQLTDFYSYKQSGLLLRLTEFFSDSYMKKSFKSILELNPQIVIFLGDLMDGGREIVDEQHYNREVDRFNHVFKATTTVKRYYMPGNHDIGINIVPEAYRRFKQNFGESNQNIKVGNTNLVLLDSIGLLARKDSIQYKNSIEFLRSNRTGNSILFTHIPLFRGEGLECGALRRATPLRQGRGYQYLNLIPQELSQQILQKIQPVLTFSGDDHDDCVYTHGLDSKKYIEHTLPTFSWLQGNLYPGYGILQLNHFENSDEIFSNTCLLPSQMWMYINSILLLAITLVVFFIYSRKTEYELLPVARNLSGSWRNQDYSSGSLIKLVLFVLILYFVLIIYDYNT